MIKYPTHVQDLIGHSAAEELHDLSREYKETFYWVYDTAVGHADRGRLNPRGK